MNNPNNQSDMNLVNLSTPINKVSPSRGWYWINEGYRYFAPAKLAWISALILVVLLVLVSRFLIPVLQIGLIFIFPFIVAGLSVACAEIELGKKMSPNYLIKGFSSSNKLNIFRYGLLFLLMMIIAQLVSSILLTTMGISQEQLTTELTALQNNKNADYQTIFASSVMMTFLIVSVISLLPLLMINLFAPIVLVFSGLTAFQSIILSFRAGLKNLSALLVYLFTYIVIFVVTILVFNFFAKFLFMVFGEGSSIANGIYLFSFLGCIMSVIAISYSSAYVAFKDIFVEEKST
jgi:hypothetical protein